MAGVMTSCPGGQSSRLGALVTDVCPKDGASNSISLQDQATICRILSRNANSVISLTQRAPGIWSLTASNTLSITDTSGILRVAFGNSESQLPLSNQTSTAGGRVVQGPTSRCVDQVAHGVVVGDWIILDSISGNWTQAFDSGATIENDAVAQVISVEDTNNFCYKPIGPFCQVSGLTLGRTYYVETDGSGDLTLSEPNDTSIPRLFAISSSEGILLPYRPVTAVAGPMEQQDIFDVDNTIVANKQVTLTVTPILETEDVFINGIAATRGGTRDYTLAGPLITFNANVDLRVGDLITIKYKS